MEEVIKVKSCPFCGEDKEVYEVPDSENYFGIYIGPYTSNIVTVSCWTCGGKMTEDVDIHWIESFDLSLSDEENINKVRKIALESCVDKWNQRFSK